MKYLAATPCPDCGSRHVLRHLACDVCADCRRVLNHGLRVAMVYVPEESTTPEQPRDDGEGGAPCTGSRVRR